MNNIIKGDQRSQMKNKHRHFETNKSDVYYIETNQRQYNTNYYKGD